MNNPPLQPKSTDTFVAQSQRRLGKGFIFAAEGDNHVFRTGDEPGKWKTLKEINESDVTISKMVSIHAYDTPDHATRFDLRESLSHTPQGMLLLGVPKPETPLAPVLTRRTLQTMMDAPRAWLSIDFDNLFLGEDFDTHAQDGELADKLFEELEARGLEWLIADCIIHLSSSHGMFTRNMMRAHVEWLLKEAMTLAQQQALVEKINTSRRGRIADPSIYQAAGVMFTAPARTFRRVWTPGDGFNDEDLPHPVRVQRVRLVKRGLTHVTVPNEVTSELVIKERVARVRTPADGKVRTPAGVNKLVITEGNVTNIYRMIRAAIYREARNCPVEQRDATRDALRESLTKQIMALPDAGDEKATRIRLSYLSEVEFNRSWAGAIEQANAAFKLDPPKPEEAAPPDGRMSVDDMRDALVTAIAQVKGESIALYEGRAEPPPEDPDDPTPLALGEVRKPEVPHLLVRVPPGTGKTHASLKSITPSELAMLRLDYFTPRIDLSQQVVDTMRGMLTSDFHKELVRLHQGREHLCTRKDTFGKLCEVYENIGRSPLKPVCTTCPDFGECPWPKQRDDTNPGLIVMQHAHITSSVARLKEDSHGRPAFAIIDESPLSTLMEAAKTKRMLSQLRRTARVASRKGRMIIGETADLMAYRGHLLKVIEAAPFVIPTAPLMEFFGQTVNVKTPKGDFTRTQLELALQAERDAARGYEDGMAKISKAAQGAATQAQMHAIVKLKNQVVISNWYTTAYKAIAASVHRPYIWGMRVHQHVDKKQIRAHIRKDLPEITGYTGMVWLDGTANEEVWQAFFGPGLTTRTMRIDVKPGPYILTQFPDKPYGRTFWNYRVNLDRLHRFVLYQSTRAPRVLLVTQEKVETDLKALGLPDNVTTKHFNDTRGSNEFKDYHCAIVVGRPAVSADELEAMTEGLYYDKPAMTTILSAGGRYFQTRRQLAVADHVDPLTGVKTAKGTVTVSAESHPDPRCEALRQQISDAEPRQAMHRLRMYDRHLLTMPEVYVFGTADMEVPIKHVRGWKDAHVPPETIVVRGGVVPLAPALLSRLFNGAFSHWGETELKELAAECKLQIQPFKVAKPCIKKEGEVNNSFLMRDVDLKWLPQQHEDGSPDYTDWRLYLVRFQDAAIAACRIAVDIGRHEDPQGAIERAIRHSVRSIRAVERSDDVCGAELAL